MANESEDTERVVILQRLKPDRVDEYVDAHDEVPDPVTETMRECGIQQWEQYVLDDVTISVVDAEDFETFQEEYGNDPEHAEWEDYVAQFKTAGIESEDFDIPVMEKVWSLEGD